MFKRIVFLILAVLIFSMGLLADSAEEKWLKWEIAIGGALQTAPMNVTLKTRYFMPFDGIHSVVPVGGIAEQMLKLDHKHSLNGGFTVELTRFLSKNSGVQVLGVFHKSPLQAKSNLLEGYLYFTYYPPPDYKPMSGKREFTMDWTDETEGTLKRSTFSLNLLRRLPLGKTLKLDLSGGLTLFRLSGDFSPMGYTVYVTDKASLYLSEYRLKTTIEPINRLGFNIGVKLRVPLGERIGIFFGGRYFWAEKVDVDTDYESISTDGSGFAHDALLAKIRDIVPPQPIKLNPAFLSILFGLTVGF